MLYLTTGLAVLGLISSAQADFFITNFRIGNLIDEPITRIGFDVTSPTAEPNPLGFHNTTCDQAIENPLCYLNVTFAGNCLDDYLSFSFEPTKDDQMYTFKMQDNSGAFGQVTFGGEDLVKAGEQCVDWVGPEDFELKAVVPYGEGA